MTIYEEGRGSSNRKGRLQSGDANRSRNGEERGGDAPCGHIRSGLVQDEMEACAGDGGGGRERSPRITTRPIPSDTERNRAPIGNRDVNLTSPTGTTLTQNRDINPALEGDDEIAPVRGNVDEVSPRRSLGVSGSGEGISGLNANIEEVPSNEGHASGTPNGRSVTRTSGCRREGRVRGQGVKISKAEEADQR